MGLGIVASCWSFGGTMLHYTPATAFVNIMITTCTDWYERQFAFYYGC